MPTLVEPIPYDAIRRSAEIPVVHPRGARGGGIGGEGVVRGAQHDLSNCVDSDVHSTTGVARVDGGGAGRGGRKGE